MIGATRLKARGMLWCTTPVIDPSLYVSHRGIVLRIRCEVSLSLSLSLSLSHLSEFVISCRYNLACSMVRLFDYPNVQSASHSNRMDNSMHHVSWRSIPTHVLSSNRYSIVN
jgi:hypothetical protein